MFWISPSSIFSLFSLFIYLFFQGSTYQKLASIKIVNNIKNILNKFNIYRTDGVTFFSYLFQTPNLDLILDVQNLSYSNFCLFFLNVLISMSDFSDFKLIGDFLHLNFMHQFGKDLCRVLIVTMPAKNYTHLYIYSGGQKYLVSMIIRLSRKIV